MAFFFPRAAQNQMSRSRVSKVPIVLGSLPTSLQGLLQHILLTAHSNSAAWLAFEEWNKCEQLAKAPQHSPAVTVYKAMPVSHLGISVSDA